MNAIEERFRSMTAKSAEIGRRAERVMPGGDTRTVAYHEPCPLTIVRGEGPFIGDELATEICERFCRGDATPPP
jgi:hypothetical protein